MQTGGELNMNFHRHLALLLAAGTLLLLLPFVMRYMYAGDVHAESAPYVAQLRIQQLQSSSPLLLFHSEGHTPAILLATALAPLSSTDFVLRYLPFAFGILALFISFFIMRRLNFDEWTTTITLLLLAASPPFLYLFSTQLNFASGVVFLLAGLYFLLGTTRTSRVLSGLCFLLLIFSGWVFVVLGVLCALIYAYLRLQKRALLYVLFFTFLMTLIFLLSPLYQNEFSLATASSFDLRIFLQQIISDFGSMFGYGIFHFLLLGYGIILSWKKKKEYSPFYILVAMLLLLAAFVDIRFILLSTFASALFIGLGFVGVFRHHWSLDLVKDMTVIVIVCGLLFSSLSFVNRFSEADPSTTFIEGVKALREQPVGTVLSHYSNGPYIIAVGGQVPYVNGFFHDGLADRQKLNISQRLFSGNNILSVLSLLQQQDIHYIFIDSSMRAGKVWEREEQGLLFLLRNEEAFPLLFKNQEVTIYGINYDISLDE